MNPSLEAYLAEQQSLALKVRCAARALENMLDAGFGDTEAAAEVACKLGSMAHDLQNALDITNIAKVAT
ncbi:hypothetical protein [Paracoccus versutus]|uniref:Uncharacterized protein n=1 Tax=Paracoccus versutus TaxID=34007 RepID=A0A3D9XD32_PARVE|nr:hypothetical protein [Paracoccus versutus]REF67408.1 hypothetical protein BDD41_4433 [Paracoccus versutus]WGR58634.1 hypothetical protein E3U25_22270 [Paracoccus versutus]